MVRYHAASMVRVYVPLPGGGGDGSPTGAFEDEKLVEQGRGHDNRGG